MRPLEEAGVHENTSTLGLHEEHASRHRHRLRGGKKCQGAGRADIALSGVWRRHAMLDLASRPANKVRGPKAAWALASFVQPVGPIAYFAVGRI